MIAADIADGEISADLSSLLLRTTDGASVVVSAERLRLSCRCAHCQRARFDGRFPARFPGIGIIGVGNLGYGFNIAFSDGHNRGIFPASYLRELAGV
ncbi:DUF971 domain-containing protein [Bradyrhizobium sp. STM 3809]|uniref:gamma-butyrobetaine hydroxylase-like domain-containing protein n=1 Tax=Bradyrhizobium sp. STM 3809 TaxID=551936 RepID=UPI0002406552|nr:DUF971 domain-containing protein [Bradyrhizobium sp. STM 3809]CCD98174.1 conserved hypothetical protein [Bradyrhizobium sp. STM 3809]